VAEVAEREQALKEPSGGTARAYRPWLVALVPALAAFLVNGYHLGRPSLWRDEAYTKDAVTRPVSQIFALLGHNDAVHGAYYVLMHFATGVSGTSEAALRFPSLCAMTVAAGFTAAIGRRATLLSGGRAASGVWPDATGLLAGLLFAVAPYTTYYAQMARSYAFVTMFAAIASYLLLRACDTPTQAGWRWWAGYGVAIAFTGLFNTFGLLLLPAHALTLLAVGGTRSWLRRDALPWLVAAVAGVLVLIPVLLESIRQRGQISWLSHPTSSTITTLAKDLAGSKALVLPMALLVAGGIAAGIADGRWQRLTPAAIALPWLLVPPVILLAVSVVKPVYSQRYAEFCLPALAILVAAGLVGLTRLVTDMGPELLRGPAMAWAPAGLLLAVIAVLLISPQHAIRQSSARPDNLRLAAQIVAANEQPGDVVFYLPDDMYVLGTGYPAPFRKLRNIGLGESAIASATLTGRELTSPAELAARFTDVIRVWVVTGASNYKFPVPSSAMDKEKMALIAKAGMQLIHRWQAGEVMLSLYALLPGGAHPGGLCAATIRLARVPGWPSRPGSARAACGGRGAGGTSRCRRGCP
jgi:mannosyltransferase